MTRKNGTYGTSGSTGRRVLAVAAGLAVVGLAACKVEPKDRARIESARASASAAEPRTAVARPDAGGSGTAVLASDTHPATVPGGVSGAGGVGTMTSPPVNVTFSDAERVFRAGDYDEAAALFEAYTVRRPSNAWGHYMLGISAWRARDHVRAEAALKRALEVDPKHGKGLINLARVLLEQRKASDALEYAEQVVALAPESGEGWRVLGNARADLGMVDEAVEAYRKALVLDHRDTWTMNNLGLLMIREGRYEEALPSLARATALRPEVAVFQNNLGVALERSGYATEAAEAFRAALNANPEYEKARVSLARVEPRVPPVEAWTPLDLGELAAVFADEIQYWKELSLRPDVEGEAPVETAGEPEEADEAPEGTVGVPEGAAGVPEGTVGVPEETAGVPDETAGVPDETAGVPEGTAGVPEETAGVPEEDR